MSFHYDLEYIRRRYNRLAAIYPLFELLLLLPRGIRAKAVERLELKPGDTVLEMGCGSGDNLRHLVNAVGPGGHVYGVDYCERMLAKAHDLCQRHQLCQVTLLRQDAAQLQLAEPVDGVLFSLSYGVMPEPRKALMQAWNYLRPGRYVVVMDGKLVAGWPGKLMRPLVIWIMKATVLGDPDIQPWVELREFSAQIEMEEVNLGTYYICRGKKR